MGRIGYEKVGFEGVKCYKILLKVAWKSLGFRTERREPDREIPNEVGSNGNLTSFSRCYILRDRNQ